jgi:hypothetical protein
VVVVVVVLLLLVMVVVGLKGYYLSLFAGQRWCARQRIGPWVSSSALVSHHQCNWCGP